MDKENDVVIDLGNVMVETRGPLAAGIPDQFQGANLPGLALSDD